jgi:hypothetical protein
MKPYQSDFLERVKQAVTNGENSMLVYRKQGYESKAFRLELKQLAQSFDGVLLEDRHAFTYVAQQYFRVGLSSYKQSHEQVDKFNRIVEALCDDYQTPANRFKDLCKVNPDGLQYMLFMCCYFLKVSESHIMSQVGDLFFNQAGNIHEHYNEMMNEFRQDYHRGIQSSQRVDEIVNSIKAATQPFIVYSWSRGHAAEPMF